MGVKYLSIQIFEGQLIKRYLTSNFYILTFNILINSDKCFKSLKIPWTKNEADLDYFLRRNLYAFFLRFPKTLSHKCIPYTLIVDTITCKFLTFHKK